jgi:hypothetical protein
MVWNRTGTWGVEVLTPVVTGSGMATACGSAEGYGWGHGSKSFIHEVSGDGIGDGAARISSGRFRIREVGFCLHPTPFPRDGSTV